MTELGPHIELLYFDDCPSWKTAVEMLSSVLADMKIDAAISLLQVDTQEKAVQYGFVGSPTIRINGKDLFPAGHEQCALGCRIYQTPEGFRGWPTEAMLMEQLAKQFKAGSACWDRSADHTSWPTKPET